jgi:hypothetical protein
MREWLVRICLRARVTRAEEIPARTLAALVAGDWLMVMGHDPRTAHVLSRGREWVQAFKDGEKSIGGKL